MDEEKYADTTLHDYVAPSAPKFRTRITVDGKDFTVKFDKGRVQLPGPVAKVLDGVLATPENSVRHYVKKVDREAALEIVRQHAAVKQAQTGPMTSDHGTKARMAQLHASQKTIGDTAPNNPEALEKFKEELGGENFNLVETVNPPQQATPDKVNTGAGKPAGAAPIKL